jgi:hypothetical protein
MQRSTNVLNALVAIDALRLAMQRKYGEVARSGQSVSNKKRMPQNKTAGLAPGGLSGRSLSRLARRRV